MQRRVKIAVAVCGGLIVLAALLATALLPKPRPHVARTPRRTESTATSASSGVGTPTAAAYPTPLEAARSLTPPGYVLELAEESERLQLFWAGPETSEWDTFITVEKSGEGWTVTKTEPWSIDEAENGSASAEDAASARSSDDAKAIIRQFLTAIQQDRPRDAQKLTIAPLHEDPASAQTSNGEFTAFKIDSVEPRGEGGYWVRTTETWTYGTERWRYDVVETGSGLRIRNIEPGE